MSDRGVRSLAHLQNSASTARVLNLLSTWRKHADNPEYSKQPFFQNFRLNRAIILKHRLRRDEFDLFERPRLTATKIIFPVDATDLKLGGRSAFVGQRGYINMLEDVIGRGDKNELEDVPLLELLDQLPSLDPFLLREELKRNGFQPASCYLELSIADLKNIFSFVQSEIEPLVRMSLGDCAGVTAQSAKLVDKILANKLDSEMEPLRQVLRLNVGEFAEGVFCWKGFLYYKWVFEGLDKPTQKVINTILRTWPLGKQDPATRDRLQSVRGVLVKRIKSSSAAIKNTLDIYDHAYAQLTQHANATAFRDFLLNAPARFAELGERLGVLQHITSFCQFRSPTNQRVTISVEELLDVFYDFESALMMPGYEDEYEAMEA